MNKLNMIEVVLNIINIVIPFALINIISVFIPFYMYQKFNFRSNNNINLLIMLFIYIIYCIFVLILSNKIFKIRTIKDINIKYTCLYIVLLIILLVLSYKFSLESLNRRGFYFQDRYWVDKSENSKV